MKSSALLFLCLFGVALLNQGRCKPSEDIDEYPQDGEGDYNDAEETETGPPAKMLSRPQTLQVDINKNVSFPCEVEGDPSQFSRVWRKNGGKGLFVGHLRQTTDTRLNHTDNGQLEIHHVNLFDEGNYTCFLSESEQVTHTLEIKTPAQITEIYPMEPYVTLKQYSSLTLRCVAGKGKPTPEVTWFKNEYALDRVKEDASLNVATYTIMNATMEDSGTYKCTAHNKLRPEPDSRVIEIQVSYPPEVKIEKGEDIIPAGEGYESELRCIVTGPKKLQVKWYKDEVPVEASKNVRMEKKGINHYLRIISTKASDFGNYKCVAKNTEGEASVVIQLTGKPKPLYQAFKNDKETNDPVVVFNITSYAPIDEYELLYKKQEEDEWEALRPSPTVSNPEEGTNIYILEQTIPGLKPGVYDAQLRAKNMHGWSEYCLAEFPKEHEGDLRHTGGLLGVVSSSAELRISVALMISLLVARFYC